MSDDPAHDILHLEVAIESPVELRALRGALLAARASELSELQRRAARQSFGYGADSARESMSAEAQHHRLRHELLDRLLQSLDDALASRG